MTKVEFIKSKLEDEKFRKKLEEVVASVNELIPETEDDFAQLQKFGLYPAEECVPFTTKQGTPFYELDNMSLSPIREENTWLHYGDYRFRQIEILYNMARMDSVEAHEWLKNNLFQGIRVDAWKKQEYKSKFRGMERKDWKSIQTEWMKYCLNLKYRDNPIFRKALHSTPKFPVEDATSTNYSSYLFWGAGLVEFEGKKYYFGCNVLGKLLTQLRETKGKLEYSLPEDMHVFGKPILNL